MNRKVRTAIYCSFIVLLLGVIVMANVMRLNSPVRGVKAVVDCGDQEALVSASTLEQQVMAAMPTLRSTPVKDVDKESVAKQVRKNPFVDSCVVTISIGGDVVINAYQRRIVARLFVGDLEFYLDRRGYYVPLSSEGFSNVLVVNGNFRQPLPKKLTAINPKYLASKKGRELKRVWTLTTYLDGHPDEGSLFDQIYLESNGDLYIVPKVGDQVVLIGSPDNLDEKMFNLMAFYKEGCKKVGWDTYSQISLKYKDQVICTERGKEPQNVVN